MVGLVSDSYFIGADIVRRRLFADFALAHMLQFDAEICAGHLLLNSAFRSNRAEKAGQICKSHVLRHLREDLGEPQILECWAMGDNLNDLAMLRSAERAFAIEPKSPLLEEIPGLIVVKSFDELLAHVPNDLSEAA